MARTKIKSRKTYVPGAAVPPSNLGGMLSRKEVNKKMTRKSVNAVPKPGKRRARPGAVALREIKKYQKSTERLIPTAPFVRLVKEVIANVTPGRKSEEARDDVQLYGTAVQGLDLRVAKEAVEVLQEAAEAHVISVMEDAQAAAIHAKRITIMPKDMGLAMKLRPDAGLMVPRTELQK